MSYVELKIALCRVKIAYVKLENLPNAKELFFDCRERELTNKNKSNRQSNNSPWGRAKIRRKENVVK